ncbi:MFS transporter [Janibacter sp. G1551]|uniref:MFS transporter n=1 Tax=Janibacter sp. G1551 TaxID=3420440 RepID=UPI003D05DC9A
MTTDVPTTARTLDPDAPAAPADHAAFATFALILGGFAIGTTEFVTMGLLPEIADGVQVTIPEAGHAISAYAIGVVIGAPLIAAFGARLPRRGLLVTLMALFAVGNAATALTSTYGGLIVARLLTGLPHGAFFGIASLVAVDMVRRGQGGRAVSRVMLGIPFANVVGVPAATWLGQNLGWRTTFAIVAVIGVVTAALVFASVPRTRGDLEATVMRELRAFHNVQVWLTLLVGAVGFGGMFAMYSYIAPLLRNVTGVGESAVPLFLLVYGVGAVIGTVMSGRLLEWSLIKTLVISLLGTGALLAVLTVTAHSPIPAALTIFAIALTVSWLVVALQVRLMIVAGEARGLGAASNHASLNIANALGAWLGGVVIAQGHGWIAPIWVGVGLSIGGALILALSLWLRRREQRSLTSGD